MPRHLQSHNHLAKSSEQSACTAPIYPGCIRKDTMIPTAKNLAEFTKNREAMTEKWIDDFATSVNEQNFVASALAFDIFSPNNSKETLEDIFSKFSGSSS